jgi:hypothetical protein
MKTQSKEREQMINEIITGKQPINSFSIEVSTDEKEKIEKSLHFENAIISQTIRLSLFYLFDKDEFIVEISGLTQDGRKWTKNNFITTQFVNYSMTSRIFDINQNKK